MSARPNVGAARVVRLRSALAASLLVLAWSPCVRPAQAQTLNLGTPRVPSMGDDAAALAQARALAGEAASLRAGVSELDPQIELRANARLLASAMLEAGQRESTGDNRALASHGPRRILLARTLAARLGAIDGLAQAGGLDAPTLAIVAADLARLVPLASDDIDSIERGLRESLAPLADAAESRNPGAPLGGWITTDVPPELGAYRALVSALSAEGTPLASAGVDALRRVDALAERATGSRAFTRSAQSIRLAVFEAARGRDSTEGLPRWIGPTARATLEPALDRALDTLSDPGRRALGLAELRRIGRLMELVRRTDALKDDQAGRRARESLSNYIAAPPSNRELESRLLAGYERALDLALAPASLPDDRLLARPLRPAWRVFADEARAASDRIADALPTLLNDSAAMTDPGTLALFNAASQALAEAKALHAVTALLTGQDAPPPGVEPVPLDRYRDLSTRLLTMSQVAARAGGSTSGEGAAAKRDLAALAIDISAWGTMPGELELRAAVAIPDPAWTTATDGREHDLLDLIGRTRTAYLDNVVAEGTLVERAALRARLQLLADLLPLVRELAVTIRTLDDLPEPAKASESGMGAPAGSTPSELPMLGDWAGWELSRQAHRLLAEGLTDAVGETVGLALRGEDERARIRVAAMRSDMAAALLPARLHMSWVRVRPGAVGPLDEIALGPADEGRAWMPASRELLAEFCALAEELPGIRLRRDDAQDRVVRAYLATLALDALAQLR